MTKRIATPAAPPAEAGKARDWVAEMKAIEARHRHLTWLRPGAHPVTRDTASWMHIGVAGDEGRAMIASRDSLPELVEYLQATLVCCLGVRLDGR